MKWFFGQLKIRYNKFQQYFALTLKILYDDFQQYFPFTLKIFEEKDTEKKKLVKYNI